MTPKELISEFHAAIDINGDNFYILEQIKELLLPGLQQYPNNEDLLLETALAFDTLIEKQDMAILFYEKIKNTARVEFIVNFARCVAQTGDKERALEIIDTSLVTTHDDVIEIRKDIEEELWG
jgi:hypothetical protein